MSRFSRRRITALRFPLAALLAASGCGDDSSSSGDTDPVDSSFFETEDPSDSMPTSNGPGPTTDPQTSETMAETEDSSDTDPPDTDNGSNGYDSLGEGAYRGVLTFTLFAPDAATDEAVLGMAGAWRDVDSPLEGIEDFFGVFGLSIGYPPPPADDDTVDVNGIPAAFEWGGAFDWELAGAAMKLRLEDTEALACLHYLGGSPIFDHPIDGPLPNYPIYVSTFSDNLAEGCEPDPDSWREDTEYDVVLYGGDAFETNSLVGQVHTPTSLEVTSPDSTVFGIEVPIDEDLEVAWTGEPTETSRLVIRVTDTFGAVLTARAADDGSFTLPGEDLATLTAGPGTLTVARENLELVPFTDGTVSVLTRYEQWVYIDLY